MGIINQRYINEANRIRTEYLKSMENLSSKENYIKGHQNNIDNLMMNISKYIDTSPSATNGEIAVDLKTELFDLESNIISITREVDILDKKIKRLENDSKTLYFVILEKYPNLTEAEIQKEILYAIRK